MSRQLSFDLPERRALGRDAFYVSPANALAVSMIEGWRDWPRAKLLLIGAEGAGKTHLAHVWAALTGAPILAAADLAGPDVDVEALARTSVAVEDVDAIAGSRAAEEALFHLHNLALAEGRSLLLTARRAPRDWGLALPDLTSRMMGTQSVALEAPDDALLSAVLVKLFADRQLAPAPETIAYITRRMERSLGAARALVEKLDTLALAEGREINRALAARVLDKTDP